MPAGVALGAVAVPAGAATGVGYVQIEPGSAAGLGSSVGRTPSTTPVIVDIAVPSSGASGTTPSARRAYQAELAARAAPVEGWLGSHGLHGTRVNSIVHLDTTAGKVDRLLRTTLRDYTYDRRTVYAAGPAYVPSTVAPYVQAVIGLSDVPVFRPNAAPVSGPAVTTGAPIPGSPSNPTSSTGSGPSGGSTIPTACSSATAEAASGSGFHTMVQAGARYGVGSLWSAGDMGAGVTVAAVELAPSSPSDISQYDACFGITDRYRAVPEDGGGTTGITNGTFEANLDIEQIQTQAPEATVLSYEAPDGFVGWVDALNPIVANPAVKVVSISWGMCEQMWTQPAQAANQIAAVDDLLSEAASQGQTIYAAASDRGSEDCSNQAISGAGGLLSVEYPASDPSLTAVGGTYVTSWSGAGTDEVWNGALGQGTGGAGGGGYSDYFAEPSWQAAAVGNLANGTCDNGSDNLSGVTTTSCRGVPDISGDAWGIVLYSGGAWEAGLGDSFAAPLYAGLTADLVPGCATSIGNMAPRLYAWYAKAGYGAGSPLTDVTVGNNDDTGDNGGLYPAAAGYDLASGLGTAELADMACPVVTSISSTGGASGGSVTLTGTGLLEASVSFGGTPATITSQSADAITATVPSGSGTVQVVVANPTGSSTGQAFTYATLAITSSASASAQIGQPFSFTVTSSDGGTSPTLTEAGPLPSGLTFVDGGIGTATISGTPASGTGGTYPLTLTLSAGGSSVTQPLVLTVGEAPSVTGPTSFTFSTTGSSTFTPTVTGYPTPTLDVTGTLPPGITFSGGSFSGAATSGDAASYQVTLTANNGVGSPASASLTLHVGSGPAFASPPPTGTWTVGSFGDVTLAADGSPTPTYAETGTLPGGLTFDTTTGVVSGTPVAGTGGMYPTTVTATDSQGSTQTSFTIVVDEAPSITAPTSTALEVGRAGTIQLGATGYPAPTFSEVGTLPSGLSFDTTTGVVSGTPVAGTTGSYPITVTATNAAGWTRKGYAIVVGQPPSFTSAASTTATVGQPMSFAVGATGTSVTFTATGLPSWATLSSSGSLTGTPTTTGTFSVQLEATDAAGSAAQTLVISVAPPTTGGTTGGGGGGGGSNPAPVGGGGGGGGGGGASPAPAPTGPTIDPTESPVSSPTVPVAPAGPTRRPAPTLTVVPSGTVHVAASGGAVDLRVRCSTSCSGTASIEVAGKVLSARRFAATTSRSIELHVPLTKGLQADIDKARGHTVLVTEVVTVGDATTVKVLRLHEPTVVAVPGATSRVRTGTVRTPVDCSLSCSGRVVLREGATVIGAGGFVVGASGRGDVTIRLSGRLVMALRPAPGRRVVVTAFVWATGARRVAEPIVLFDATGGALVARVIGPSTSKRIGGRPGGARG